jgi:hypothetical protein
MSVPVSGQRAVELSVPVPLATQTSIPANLPTLFANRYALETTAKRGRRMTMPGTAMLTIGGVFTIGGTVASFAAFPGDRNGRIGVASFLLGSAALFSAGLWMVIRGTRMDRHPHEFLGLARDSSYQQHSEGLRWWVPWVAASYEVVCRRCCSRWSS